MKVSQLGFAEDASWMALATSASVVRRATIVALVVGTILVIINHGDAIARGDLSVGRLLRIALTMMVPYCVSTYSSVSALRASAREQRREARS
ncbi:MAG TPA: nitrate/nitrite transporter NrtS [Vicinamibacterales bacterium]